MMVPRSRASSISNRVSPGTKPSATALFHDFEFLRWPDDDVDAVVALVERLTGALHAVADDGHGFVLQDLLGLGQGKFFAGDDIFYGAAEV